MDEEDFLFKTHEELERWRSYKTIIRLELCIKGMLSDLYLWKETVIVLFDSQCRDTDRLGKDDPLRITRNGPEGLRRR